MENFDKRKNLLLVGPYPPPFGGVSSHLYELNKSFRETHYNSHILQFDKITEHHNKDGAKIFKRASNLSLKHIWILLKRIDKFLKVINLLVLNVFKSPRLYVGSLVKSLHVVEMVDKYEISRTVVYTTKIGALIPFVKILRPKHDIFYCIYADPYKNPKFYRKHKSIYRKAVEASTKVFSSSCYCAESYGSFTKAINPSVIYVGVDLERFHVMDSKVSRQSLSLQNRPTILFLGRMEPEMGADNALRIAEIILSKENNINFVIAGAKGSLTEYINEQSKKYGGRLVVATNVEKDDLPKFYGAATISIAPTLGLHACMGVSIKESMASGRAIVASNSGGIPEAIRHDKDGYVVPIIDGKIDNEAFAEAITALLHDKVRIERYGISARERCEEIFSVNKTAQKYLELFETKNL